VAAHVDARGETPVLLVAELPIRKVFTFYVIRAKVFYVLRKNPRRFYDYVKSLFEDFSPAGAAAARERASRRRGRAAGLSSRPIGAILTTVLAAPRRRGPREHKRDERGQPRPRVLRVSAAAGRCGWRGDGRPSDFAQFRASH
jgi:hypothetical protein